MTIDSDYSSIMIAGKYLIQDLAGEGSMSVVYRGTEHNTGKTVAVKIMKRSLMDDEEIDARFVREIQTCMNLNHKNLVKVYDSGRLSTGEPYLIMEFLEGNSVAELLESHKILPPARALNIIYQAAKALGTAHKRGYVHRDIKPQNLMVVNNFIKRDYVKVLDFGVAKLSATLQQSEKFATLPGHVLGTPLYMSPEQILGSPIDGRADIYALGCVLYQCLCGKPAIAGNNAIEVMQNHLALVPPHLNYYSSKINDENSSPIKYSDELNALVQKAIAKQPESRYQNMSEFASAIHRYTTPPFLAKLLNVLKIGKKEQTLNPELYRAKHQKKRK